MKTLKLHEIHDLNESDYNSMLIELLIPYKKSLYTLFKERYCSEPILVVTSVSNAAQYGFISSENSFSEDVENWVASMELDGEEHENEIELIGFNSIMLKDL